MHVDVCFRFRFVRALQYFVVLVLHRSSLATMGSGSDSPPPLAESSSEGDQGQSVSSHTSSDEAASGANKSPEQAASSTAPLEKRISIATVLNEQGR